MEPSRSLPCFVDGLWTDAQSEARPPCLLECITSTVGKHHGQSSILHPFLTMAISPTNAHHQLTAPILHHLKQPNDTCSCLDDSVSHTLV